MSIIPRSAQFARVYLTAKNTNFRLTEVSNGIKFFSRKSGPNHINATYVFVDPKKRFQSMIGIGGAITDASAEVFAKLSSEKQREFMTAQYGTEKGIGYTLARVNMNSCDFSSDMYTYCADGDTDLKSFSIAHDLKYKVPMLKCALETAGHNFPVFFSPWSPPGWMKDNGSMLHGGKLLPQYYDAWARYFVKFIEHYRHQGINFWGCTVQNEPEYNSDWESCTYTPEEERDFIRDHLGPTLHNAGLENLNLIAWDHNRDHMYEWARVILDDPHAAKYVWGIGYHWYTQDCYGNVGLVRDSFPDVHLIFTEGCHTILNKDTWLNGEYYGIAVINDLNHGCEAWCDWNVLLDTKGGPNHVGNYCTAPVHADLETGELIYTPSYYYLGHFSKFIRPGYRRVACSSAADAILATAYMPLDSKEGEVVVVTMNKGDEDHLMKIAIGDREMVMTLPAHSIATTVVEIA